MDNSTIDKYAARLLMLSFFLPMTVQVMAVMAVSVYFVWRTFSIKQPIPRTNYMWALVLGSGFLLYLLAIPITPGIFSKELLSLCGHKVSFLLMPFVFAITTPAFGTVIKRELGWFVYGCVAACLYANAYVLYQFYFAHSGIVISHVSYRVTFQHGIDIHPTYMGMYLAFAMCVLLFSHELGVGISKTVRYALLYLMLVFLLAILAKSPLIALVLIFIHYAYIRRHSLYKYKMLFVGMVLAVTAACIFIPFVSQRINEMLQFFSHSKSGNIVDNSMYARQQIWGVNMDLLKHYWSTGIGPGRLAQAFKERYFFCYLGNTAVLPIHDPHNEYLYEWLSFGLLGIVVYLGIFLTYLIKALRVKDYLNIYLLLILYITFFTESVLATQRGILFYAVFTSLFFYLKSTTPQESLKS